MARIVAPPGRGRKMERGRGNMSEKQPSDLSGKRIIVVQDDIRLGSKIIDHLRGLGVTALGPAPTPFYADLIIGRRKIDAALLDIQLHGETVFDLADRMVALGIPIIFVTDYDRTKLPARYEETPFLGLPPDWERLPLELTKIIYKPLPVRPKIIPPSFSTNVLEGPIQAFARTIARHLVAQSDLR
jgi:CheY-like chemotaxis protein